MKKKGIYFTENKKPETEAVSGEGMSRQKQILLRVLIYGVMTFGAIIIYFFVRTNGTAYLTAYLLALFIMVTCVEVYLSRPEKKSFSLLNKLLHKK